jgi:hypothetical protein
MAALDKRVLTFNVEDNAAGTGSTYPLLIADRKMDIREINFASKTTTAAHASNYVTVALKNGSDTIGSATTVTVLTAAVFRALTLTAANIRVSAGDTLTLVLTHSGTGAATDGLVVQIEADPVE